MSCLSSRPYRTSGKKKRPSRKSVGRRDCNSSLFACSRKQALESLRATPGPSGLAPETTLPNPLNQSQTNHIRNRYTVWAVWIQSRFRTFLRREGRTIIPKELLLLSLSLLVRRRHFILCFTSSTFHSNKFTTVTLNALMAAAAKGKAGASPARSRRFLQELPGPSRAGTFMAYRADIRARRESASPIQGRLAGRATTRLRQGGPSITEQGSSGASKDTQTINSDCALPRRPGRPHSYAE